MLILAPGLIHSKVLTLTAIFSLLLNIIYYFENFVLMDLNYLVEVVVVEAKKIIVKLLRVYY